MGMIGNCSADLRLLTEAVFGYAETVHFIMQNQTQFLETLQKQVSVSQWIMCYFVLYLLISVAVEQ